MDANNILFKASHGKRTSLDKAYNKLINNVLSVIDEETETRWEFYDFIIKELSGSIKDRYFNELKYRLTDGENANEIFLDIIDREHETPNDFLWFLRNRVSEFLEEDYFKRFFV